jgi:hypothetical protein
MQRSGAEVDVLDRRMIGMMPRPVWPGKTIAAVGASSAQIAALLPCHVAKAGSRRHGRLD